MAGPAPWPDVVPGPGDASIFYGALCEVKTQDPLGDVGYGEKHDEPGRKVIPARGHLHGLPVGELPQQVDPARREKAGQKQEVVNKILVDEGVVLLFKLPCRRRRETRPKGIGPKNVHLNHDILLLLRLMIKALPVFSLFL